MSASIQSDRSGRLEKIGAKPKGLSACLPGPHRFEGNPFRLGIVSGEPRGDGRHLRKSTAERLAQRPYRWVFNDRL